MNRKIIITSSIAVLALAAVGAGTLLNANKNFGVYGETSRTITFTGAEATSSGGASFYLVGCQSDSISYDSNEDVFGSVKNFHYLDIYSKETKSIANFAKITKISLTYHIPGDATNLGCFKLGDATTGNFDDAITYSYDGTRNTEQTVNFYPSGSQGENKAVRFSNTCAMWVYIKSFAITYSC